MLSKRERISKSLKRYVPEEFIPYITDLMFSQSLSFTVSKPRSTKLGDYSMPHKDKPHRITVNGNLNPYAFMITTIHEFAHLNTHVKHGSRVKAHGDEWKAEFRSLLIPIINMGTLPKDIEIAIIKSINNPKASSCTDLHLSRALKKYDLRQESMVLLEEVGNNSYFRLKDRVFQRGNLRRSRYLCKEIKTGKQFLVSRMAEVEPIKETI
ncbi:MAG: sprT domain-containing protein [Brumimicrobium sp.]|nr:sprT domain-containing protein [Brumimicrobium sp.]MCO5267698.1 SprT-like domain-containing protein [Brumimicrobium sp.]